MSNLTTTREEAVDPLLAEIRRLEQHFGDTFEAVNRLSADDERQVDTRAVSDLLTALAFVRKAEKELLAGAAPGHAPRF